MAPNGTLRTEEELKAIEAAFSLIGPTIEKFARKKGLQITKYYHGAATWILQFVRRKGGAATITIGLDERTRKDFYIVSCWWIDEYEAEMRHARDQIIGKHHTAEDPQKFAQLLEQALQAIKSWQFSDLNRHDGPMENWKRTWPTKEAFEQAGYQNYPILDI